MKKITAYKCKKCGELYEKKEVCECVKKGACTHLNIADRFMYTSNESDKFCRSCLNAGGVRLRRERGERLKNNGWLRR